MNILLYAGPAPKRNAVLEFSAPIVQRAATTLTLVTGGGSGCADLLKDAARRLNIPPHILVTYSALPGSAQDAILRAVHDTPYDLVILGRLQQPLSRLIHGQRSKMIAQRLEPSVLRIDGPVNPIQRVLLASGGDQHTLDNARIAARLAAPLAANVTLLHVLSQQSLVFEGFPEHCLPISTFLQGNAPEALVLREAASLLQHLQVKTQTKGRVGPILDEILTEVQRGHYDLLVIGAHCVKSALDRILLENIAGDLLDLSPIPVLVAKNGEA
ncbi:MAG: universal stress protein [Chloroflexales bacterium]|nr:universal stress protein [Chloroflexales bacterium]